MNRVWLWPLVVVWVGCAHEPRWPKAPRAAAPEAPPPTEATHRPYQLIDAPTGEALDDEAFAQRLRDARLIFVGEQHDDPAHHGFQHDVLARVHREDPSVGVAFEMLPYTLQEPLTAFAAGRLDEAAFTQAVDWEKTWGFPFGFYRPLLAFARTHGLPAYALNAPRTLSRKIYRGGLASLSPEEAKDLPDMEPGPGAHREFAREAYGGHGHRRFSDPAFERFYEAQLTWDETMAAKLAAHLQGEGAPTRIVVVAGEGHTRPFAIPDRALRRGGGPVLLLLAIERADLDDARAAQVADVLAVFEDTPPPTP
ncbi:MAG: ChaN family lipoprotein [Myxococcales bacterium]|nr:ChaN family lipoprotein [Myxococcales bacterium]